ncbi:hypothetical protein EYF80_057945 [Liparis tanakae]|uniref:Uncharacterized protein n=1 Tax=Liparis tanakae TaxID=230148 RepID=A0A4Z2EU36_9TELE|nr:hypothetical protein EYF80_057945 [Liparis tanakae]
MVDGIRNAAYLPKTGGRCLSPGERPAVPEAPPPRGARASWTSEPKRLQGLSHRTADSEATEDALCGAFSGVSSKSALPEY